MDPIFVLLILIPLAGCILGQAIHSQHLQDRIKNLETEGNITHRRISPLEKDVSVLKSEMLVAREILGPQADKEVQEAIDDMQDCLHELDSFSESNNTPA